MDETYANAKKAYRDELDSYANVLKKTKNKPAYVRYQFRPSQMEVTTYKCSKQFKFADGCNICCSRGYHNCYKSGSANARYHDVLRGGQPFEVYRIKDVVFTCPLYEKRMRVLFRPFRIADDMVRVILDYIPIAWTPEIMYARRHPSLDHESQYLQPCMAALPMRIYFAIQFPKKLEHGQLYAVCDAAPHHVGWRRKTRNVRKKGPHTLEELEASELPKEAEWYGDRRCVYRKNIDDSAVFFPVTREYTIPFVRSTNWHLDRPVELLFHMSKRDFGF
jgi:hypothetical protein